jgi:hypothetical protein
MSPQNGALLYLLRYATWSGVSAPNNSPMADPVADLFAASAAHLSGIDYAYTRGTGDSDDDDTDSSCVAFIVRLQCARSRAATADGGTLLHSHSFTMDAHLKSSVSKHYNFPG